MNFFGSILFTIGFSFFHFSDVEIGWIPGHEEWALHPVAHVRSLPDIHVNDNVFGDPIYVVR